MKKILFSLMAIALVVGLVGAGAFAQFDDTETSTGNTFTAGTLDLTVNDMDDPDVEVFTIGGDTGLKPGDIDMAACYVLTNVGSIAGVPSFHICDIVSDENGLEEPEVKLGDTEDEGELDGQLCLTIWIDDCDWEYDPDNPDDILLHKCKVDTIVDCDDFLADQGIVLGEDDSIKLCIAYEFQDEVPEINNLAQGDSVTMTLIFDLLQAAD